MKFAHYEKVNKSAATRRIDLGLAILSVLRKPGQTLTSNDIAAWCDCSGQAIRQIEAKAIRRLRNKFSAQERELFAALTSERRVALPPAHPTGSSGVYFELRAA